MKGEEDSRFRVQGGVHFLMAPSYERSNQDAGGDGEMGGGSRASPSQAALTPGAEQKCVKCLRTSQRLITAAQGANRPRSGASSTRHTTTQRLLGGASQDQTRTRSF